MAIRAVFLDLDQTLLDRDRSLAGFLQWQTAGMLRADLDDPEGYIDRFLELDCNGQLWKDEVFRQLIEEFGLRTWAMEELLAVYETAFCAFCEPRPGVDDALEALRGSYRLGLISNGKTPFQERNFRALGCSGYFASILVSDAVQVRKPDSKIFHLGCAELDVLPDQAVFVGDNPNADIAGARRAGLKTIFIPSRSHPVCDLADATCPDMRALPRLITELPGEPASPGGGVDA